QNENCKMKIANCAICAISIFQLVIGIPVSARLRRSLMFVAPRRDSSPAPVGVVCSCGDADRIAEHIAPPGKTIDGYMFYKHCAPPGHTGKASEIAIASSSRPGPDPGHVERIAYLESRGSSRARQSSECAIRHVRRNRAIPAPTTPGTVSHLPLQSISF